MAVEQRHSTFVIAIELFKLLFLAVVSPIIIYLAASELFTALREPSPTPFQVERFADDYRGRHLAAWAARRRQMEQVEVSLLDPILRGLLLNRKRSVYRRWIVRQDWRCGRHAAARKPDWDPLAIRCSLFSPRAVPMERPRPTIRAWHSRRQGR